MSALTTSVSSKRSKSMRQILPMLIFFAISVFASPIITPIMPMVRPRGFIPYSWDLVHLETDLACTSSYSGSISESVTLSAEYLGLDYYCRLLDMQLLGPYIMFCPISVPPGYVRELVSAPLPNNPDNKKGICRQARLFSDTPQAHHKVHGDSPRARVRQRPTSSSSSGTHQPVPALIHAGGTACIDTSSVAGQNHALEAYVTASGSPRDVFASYIAWYEVGPIPRLVSRLQMVEESTIKTAVEGGIYRACAAALAGAGSIMLHATTSSVS